MQRWFESNGVRCVVAASVVEGVGLPSIDLDYRAVCRHAAGLLRARGRRSAVLVLPENKAVGDVESWAGFTDGYGAESRLVLHDGTADEVRRAVRIAMKLKPQPDAFVVARSAHALTVLTYLMSEGIRVPEQVVVISRDDDSFLAHTVPEVARYSTDPRVWAQRLFVQVEKLAAGERSRSGTLRLVPKLVVGGSLG